ncbi:hypothetical protein ACFXP7_01110 [Microbacterium sp. P06]|uniref:hypothetical protein n=1 Tax=Microbacterium sp. P06 TaxID=3366949 RepID=UPI00374768C7
MRLRSTSTQRTYRYVRLSLVGVIAFLAVSLTVEIVTGGPLASVSAAFYTPARDVLVGSLCAVALALLVLSGRSVEQMLLDVAALLAPVIAFVPTPVAPADIAAGCAGGSSCVPEQFLPGIANSLISLGIVAVVGIATVSIVALARGTFDRAMLVSVAAAGVVVAALGGWWMLSPSTFLLGAHNAAAVVFFTLIALVAALAAGQPAGSDSRRTRLRVAYGVIAAGIALALALVIGVVVAGAEPAVPLFFVGEAAALLLFAVFWVVQTIEFWNDVDPRARVAAEPSAA